MSSVALDNGFSAMLAFRSVRMGLFLGREQRPAAQRPEIVDVEAEVLNAPRRSQVSPALESAPPRRLAATRAYAANETRPAPRPANPLTYRPVHATGESARAVMQPPAPGRLVDTFA